MVLLEWILAGQKLIVTAKALAVLTPEGITTEASTIIDVALLWVVLRLDRDGLFLNFVYEASQGLSYVVKYIVLKVCNIVAIEPNEEFKCRQTRRLKRSLLIICLRLAFKILLLVL